MRRIGGRWRTASLSMPRGFGAGLARVDTSSISTVVTQTHRAFTALLS